MGTEQIASLCGEENTATEKLKLSVHDPNKIHFPSHIRLDSVVW